MNKVGHRLSLLMTQPEKLWGVACVAVLFPLCLYIMICFVFSSDLLGMGPRSAQRMVEGSAMKPHVYRQLVPAITREVLALTPASVERAAPAVLHDFLWNQFLFQNIVKVRHGDDIPPEIDDENLYLLCVVTFIDYAFLVGYTYMLWNLAFKLFPNRFSIHLLTPLLGLLALPPFCSKYAYIYDFPLLFFTAWLACLLIDKKLWWFDFGVALATFNKETTIYMVALFIIYGYRIWPRNIWAMHSTIQIIIFSAIKISLSFYYRDNTGTPLDYGVPGHLHMGLDGYNVYTLLGLGAALALFSYRWPEKPLFLKCWLTLLPPMILAWFFFGNRDEYRVYYDIFPCLTLLAAHTFSTALRWTDEVQGVQGS